MPNPALALALLTVAAGMTDFDSEHKGIGGTLPKYRAGGLFGEGLGDGFVGPLGEPLQEWLQCPGVDVDEFLADCRAPIFRDMWNRWTLVRSTSDGISEAEMHDAVVAFMSRLSVVLDGKIRHVRVGPPQAWPVMGTSQNACGYEMGLRESKFTPQAYAVGVEFVYRGSLAHIPWPAMKRDLEVFASDCPHNADWLLDTVHTPSQIDVPPVESDSPLPPIMDPDNKLDPSQPWFGHEPELGLGGTIALAGGAAVVLAVLAGYVVRSVR